MAILRSLYIKVKQAVNIECVLQQAIGFIVIFG